MSRTSGFIGVLRSRSTLRRVARSCREIAIPILPFVLLGGLWWLVSLSNIPAYILPSPMSVLREAINPRWRWSMHVLRTVQEFLGGFGIAAIVGILLGIIVSWNNNIRKALMPLIVFFNSLPKVAAAPLVLVWFGYGLIPTTLMAFIISFFPILLNTAYGIGAVPTEMIELALSFRTPKWKRYLKIHIPYALPYIMAGLKLASLMAVTGAIVGEFIAAERGLAALIMQAQAYVQTAAMVAALVYISVLAMGFYSVINIVEWLLFPWARKPESK